MHFDRGYHARGERMPQRFSRRSALAFGAAGAVGVATGAVSGAADARATPVDGPLHKPAPPVDPAPPADPVPPTADPPSVPAWQRRIRRAYQAQKSSAGGLWHSYVGAFTAGGFIEPVVADDADYVIEGASVQKLAVAAAVLDRVDRGELSLDQRLDLPEEATLGGTSGIYHLQTVWGDQVTLANVLTALLVVSDNTAVRLCGRLVPGPEINAFLAGNGFVHTRVQPVPGNPQRFYLGETTPRETVDLLTRLARRTLLSTRSGDLVLGLTRALSGYHDGVRREMSSAQRLRVATKYGADDHLRHEAGIMFAADGAPALVYGFFADALSDPDNYGGTHPAVRAHAELGRTMMESLDAR